MHRAQAPPRRRHVSRRDDVLASLGQADAWLVDARSAEMFAGQDKAAMLPLLLAGGIAILAARPARDVTKQRSERQAPRVALQPVVVGLLLRAERVDARVGIGDAVGGDGGSSSGSGSTGDGGSGSGDGDPIVVLIFFLIFGGVVVWMLVKSALYARKVRELMPKAHFATVYAKPAGRPLVDNFVTEVSQDTWILFPWDIEPQFIQPIAQRQQR